MLKNISIRNLTFYIVIAVWLISLVFSFIFLEYTYTDVELLPFLIFQSVSLVLYYFIIKYLFEYFIFRQVKLLYKVIRQTKSSMPKVLDRDDFASKTSLSDVEADVTEWASNTEKEIIQLKSLEEYRRNFLGDISHELKTPLFSIQGYLHTLLEGGLYDSSINLKYVKNAMKNAKRLQFIVDELEMINNLESNKEMIKMQNFEIKKLVEEVFGDLELLAADKNIQLKFKNGADDNFLVEADREAMRKVFNNLISNSIKYGNENGTTKVSFYNMEKEILVEVSDNGIGIEDKHLKHVFDRFYRIDGSRSRALGGSGLGLSIVKHIIEAHEQHITLRSTIKLGSTFGFTLKKAI